MAKTCFVCNKGKVFGSSVSHSNRHNKRVWLPNLRKVKAVVNGSTRRVNVCTRCLRSGRIERAL